MTHTLTAETIFIVDGDPVTAYSQKYFLETHEQLVELVEEEKTKVAPEMGRENIVIMDISLERSYNFSILSDLLQRKERPKLLITTFENHIFRKDDFLSGGPWKFLFKPFKPSDLLSAVFHLKSVEHA